MGAVARNKGLICAKNNGAKAVLSGNNNILVTQNLIELVNHFKGIQILSPPELEVDNSETYYADFKDIKGQEIAKRALEIAAANFNYSLLMFVGPPGTGKSMLAQCIAGILPKICPKAILECSTITSIAGKLENGKLTRTRFSCSSPFMLYSSYGWLWYW